ncbi:MAG: M48 family metallopeptidase [Arcobacter butzleri]|jgi:predicted metal-dependent hydrolase|nr:M48 family metallopeptidase [Arcobacteraceae bacterium]MDY0364313.1 SprT family zinc-dependent metalloprotease [Arcobacteraceae bacterium]NLO16771.1 M48 family metallopeptidase [Aliarcobacter butzleri]
MKINIVKKEIKNSYIRIYPTLEVRVSVPKNVSKHYIDTLIKSKQSWIEHKIKQLKTKQEEGVLAENEVLFLGKKYKIKSIISKEDKVEFDKEYLVLYVKKDTKEYQKRLIESFLSSSAKSLLGEIVKNYSILVQKNINYVRIKKMSSRWGSCNYLKAGINLNSELIKKPLAFIEYVVLHELAHLTHPNHSKEFYAYIEQYMFDWKQRCKL